MSGDLIRKPGRTEQDEDIARLREELRRVAIEIDPCSRPTGWADPAAAVRLRLADGMIAARRLIGAHFSVALFADPARDLLLDLYVAMMRGREVALSQACIVAGVSAATALRCIGQLHGVGMVVIQADRRDARRILVRLSGEAMTSMDRYLDDVRAVARAIP